MSIKTCGAICIYPKYKADFGCNLCALIKKEHTDIDEHFEVWVMLEKWKGDDKLEEVETCKVGNVVDEDGGRELFDAAQTMSMSVRSLIESTVRVYDD